MTILARDWHCAAFHTIQLHPLHSELWATSIIHGQDEKLIFLTALINSVLSLPPLSCIFISVTLGFMAFAWEEGGAADTRTTLTLKVNDILTYWSHFSGPAPLDGLWSSVTQGKKIHIPILITIYIFTTRQENVILLFCYCKSQQNIWSSQLRQISWKIHFHFSSFLTKDPEDIHGTAL